MRRVGCEQVSQQKLRRRGRDGQAEDASDCRQHHALDEQLTDNPAAAGAEREADGNLPAAGRAARQLQAGNVHASDQKDQACDDQQHREKQVDCQHLPLSLDPGEAGDG